MKKPILISTLISIVLTFVFSEILSIYHIGTIPTLLTTLYLIAMFLIFEYIFIVASYLIKNINKINIKKIIGLILLFISLLLILLFVIIINVDYLNWYQYSSPFYINVIVRSLEMLLPSLILIISSIVLFKKK